MLNKQSTLFWPIRSIRTERQNIFAPKIPCGGNSGCGHATDAYLLFCLICFLLGFKGNLSLLEMFFVFRLKKKTRGSRANGSYLLNWSRALEGPAGRAPAPVGKRSHANWRRTLAQCIKRLGICDIATGRPSLAFCPYCPFGAPSCCFFSPTRPPSSARLPFFGRVPLLN